MDMTPITRADRYAVAAPGADTNILGTGITPTFTGALRLTIVLATASIFNVTTTDGSTSYTSSLNDGVALSATRLYTFTFGCSKSLTYNFQVATNGIIRILQVDEIPSAVI